jgi:hypothetical protein
VTAATAANPMNRRARTGPGVAPHLGRARRPPKVRQGGTLAKGYFRFLLWEGRPTEVVPFMRVCASDYGAGITAREDRPEANRDSPHHRRATQVVAEALGVVPD